MKRALRFNLLRRAKGFSLQSLAPVFWIVYVSGMIEKEFKDRVKLISETRTQKVDKLYEWVKQVLVLCAGLLSVLVALHTNKSYCIYEKYSYMSTIFLLTLGILSGVIYLFSEVNVLHKIEGEMIEQLNKYNNSEKTDAVIDVQPDKIYKFFYWFFLLSLLLSVISLLYYAYLKA